MNLIVSYDDIFPCTSFLYNNCFVSIVEFVDARQYSLCMRYRCAHIEPILQSVHTSEQQYS